MNDLANNLKKEFKERQEKLVYYLMALNVSCIGFSMYNGKEDVLNITILFFLIAVILWSTSVYFGLRFIKTQLSVLYDNIWLNEFENQNKTQNDSIDCFTTLLNKKYNHIESDFNMIWRFFIGGTVFYFVYHLIKLIINSQ